MSEILKKDSEEYLDLLFSLKNELDVISSLKSAKLLNKKIRKYVDTEISIKYNYQSNITIKELKEMLPLNHPSRKFVLLQTENDILIENLLIQYGNNK